MNISEVLLFDFDRNYVEDMTEHHQLTENGEGLVDFGTPVVAAISTLLTATAIAPGGTILLGASNGLGKQGITVDGTFGRIVQVTSTATGDVTITGRDYLGQIITQTVTCIIGNVSTLKAFKKLDKITSVSVTGNVSIGPGAKLGLPFTCAEIFNEYADGVAATEGTLTVPVSTNPATAATGDPRGTYTPGTTLNGVKRVELNARFTNRLTGGLYGVRGV